MTSEHVLKILALLRTLSFMVFVYLAFGLLVERLSRKPDSQLKAFARIVCSPVTRPVARFLAPGASQRRLLVLGMGVVSVFWAVLVVLFRAISPA
jgi:uncharacterized protein YggT (Ycf19 family)